MPPGEGSRTCSPCGPGSEWCVLLCAADYPIMPRDQVPTDLGGTGVDAYMHHGPIEQGHGASAWQRLCAERCLPRRLEAKVRSQREQRAPGYDTARAFATRQFIP